MQIAKRNDIIRIIVLTAVVFISASAFFGSRIFLHRDYIIYWPNNSSLIFRSWYLLVGLIAIIIHFFSFLREWYHNFRRELMNLVVLIISILLLAYCTLGYFGISGLQQYLTTTTDKLLSIQGIQIYAIDYSFLQEIKIGILILVTWVVFTTLVFFIKLLPVLRRKTNKE